MTSNINSNNKTLYNWLCMKVPEWSDDARVEWYMSDFKESRGVNPEHWDSLLRFWKRVLEEACTFHRVFVLDATKIVGLLKRPKQKGSGTQFPLGWQRLVVELEREGILLKLSDYSKKFNGEPDNSSIFSPSVIGGWMFSNMVKKPVVWAWSSTVGSSGSKPTVPQGVQFVHVGIVKSEAEKFCDHVYNNYNAYEDLLLTPAQVTEYFSFITSEELRLMLNYLGTTKLAAVTDLTSKGDKALKFPEQRGQLTKFTETDMGILHVKYTIEKLEKQKARLESQIERCTKEAREYIRNKQKEIAKHSLAKKGILEKTLRRIMALLKNLIEVLHSIYEAGMNKEVLKALKLGSLSLKQATKELRDMGVEETMDEMQDALSEMEDIQGVFNSGYQTMDKEEEEELLAELESLLLDDYEKTEAVAEKAEEVVKDEEEEGEEHPSSTKDEHNGKKEEEDLQKNTKQQRQPLSIEDMSLKQLEWELGEIESALVGAQQQHQDSAAALRKQKEELVLAIKLATLKRKTLSKNKEALDAHVAELRAKADEYELLALENQKKDFKLALRLLKHKELLEEEIEELAAAAAAVVASDTTATNALLPQHEEVLMDGEPAMAS